MRIIYPLALAAIVLANLLANCQAGSPPPKVYTKFEPFPVGTDAKADLEKKLELLRKPVLCGAAK
jgi:hypothetical protein